MPYTEAMDTPMFDPTRKNDKVTVPTGTILTLQGGPVTSLILLHTGMAEILDNPDPKKAMDSIALVEDSVRVGIFKGESMCGISGFFGSEPDRFTIRTMSECQVSSIPVTSPEAMANLQGKKGLNFQILRAFQRRIESSLFLLNSYKELWHRLASIADSLALCQDWAKPGPRTAELPLAQANRLTQKIEDYSLALRGAARAKKLEMPGDWDQNWLLDTLKYALDRFSSIDSLDGEKLVDFPQYLFIKRIVNRPDNILTALFDQDEPSIYYIFQFLSRSLDKLLETNRGLALEIRDLAAKVYGPKGWVEQVLDLAGRNPDKGRIGLFLHYLWKFSIPFHADMQKLLDINLSRIYPAFGKLNLYKNEPVNAPTPTDSTPSGPSVPSAATTFSEPSVQLRPSENFLRTLENYPQELARYSECGPDIEEQWISTLAEFRKLPDKLMVDPYALQIRTRLTDLYWKIYEGCFLKSVERGFKEAIPGYMLHFGLVDKDLLTPEELARIEQYWSQALAVDSPIPVMTLPYFLEKIYLGQVNPSMSEMGETFAEVIRNQAKMTNKERLGATRIWENTPEHRVSYEIRVIASNLASLLSGSKKRSVPVLCSENIMGNINRNYQNPQGLSDYVDSLRQRDFMVFVREVVSKHALGTDLIMKEVLPNIVVYPCGGTRGMMWGEFDGTKKDSAARIFIPLFYSGNRDELVVELLAHLRWEISKTIAGHNWMDPVEGGLTGAYYDYITYYKKNPNLSLAHKDTLRDFIARTRSDKDRFALDYADWVIHEYDNKVRLNPVAREIFYRFCPFPKEVRSEMAKKGLYMDNETRYQNRTRKDLLALETKLKKFEKNGLEIPVDVQAYQDLLNR